MNPFSRHPPVSMSTRPRGFRGRIRVSSLLPVNSTVQTSDPLSNGPTRPRTLSAHLHRNNYRREGRLDSINPHGLLEPVTGGVIAADARFRNEITQEEPPPPYSKNPLPGEIGTRYPEEFIF